MCYDLLRFSPCFEICAFLPATASQKCQFFPPLPTQPNQGHPNTPKTPHKQASQLAPAAPDEHSPPQAPRQHPSCLGLFMSAREYIQNPPGNRQGTKSTTVGMPICQLLRLRQDTSRFLCQLPTGKSDMPSPTQHHTPHHAACSTNRKMNGPSQIRHKPTFYVTYYVK